jgi:hypothetical protein
VELDAETFLKLCLRVAVCEGREEEKKRRFCQHEKIMKIIMGAREQRKEEKKNRTCRHGFVYSDRGGLTNFAN